MNEPDTDNLKGPGLARRLVVIVYDGLLLAGVVFASWVVLWILLLAVPDGIEAHPAVTFIKQCYLVGVTLIFYGWFWVNGGQTLGMRAWRMQLVSSSGGPITWRLAAARYVCAMVSWAIVAMGFMWVLVDRRNRTWHGMLSGTRMELLKKRKSGSTP